MPAGFQARLACKIGTTRSGRELCCSQNENLFAPFLGGSHAQPLTLGIARFAGGVEQGAQYGVIAAQVFSIVAPVILVALVASRYIVSGMPAGAVEG